MAVMDEDRSSILIVDDKPDKLLVYRTVLEELHQDLVTVSSGHEALKKVLHQDFAVILLDVQMPDMDGFETARYIRQRKRSAHTPIIFLTAFSDEMRIAEGYAHGAVDYILTPVVPEVLRAKVRVFVELHRMRRQVARQAEEQARREAAEEQARRSAFLADASRILTSSLDVETTLRGLLQLVVPVLADVASVTRAGTPGTPWTSEIAWADAGTVRFLTLTEANAPNDALRACHDRVLASGTTEVLAGLDVPYPPVPHEPCGRLRNAVALALVARGHTLGVLTLAQKRPDSPLRPTDLALAEDLAGRAAIALDNALLVRDIQENDRRKNEFLAMLAHELRNPLAPVRNAVELLRLRDPGKPELVWARDVIDRQVRHLVRLVDDLLDVSRITRGKINLHLEIIDVRSVVNSAVETSRPLIDTHRHQFALTVPERPLRVRADAARLAQVLTNLLNNAAKYTPDGGRIALTVEREGKEAVFRIRDTGAGIPREMLATVFDLFTQVDHSLDRAQGGLGIGLTLVRRLVEMHGGTVHAFSEGPGRGSEFTVRLPALADERSDRPEMNGGPPSEAALVRPSRVLVVDDNVDAADSLAVLLRLGGHQVRICHDGPSALEITHTFRPDVVLLDIGLPGLDGFEVARRLRIDYPASSLLLIAVSGYGQEEDRQRAREVGFDHHLIKPLDLNALYRILPSVPSSPAQPVPSSTGV